MDVTNVLRLQFVYSAVLCSTSILATFAALAVRLWSVAPSAETVPIVSPAMAVTISILAATFANLVAQLMVVLSAMGLLLALRVLLGTTSTTLFVMLAPLF